MRQAPDGGGLGKRSEKSETNALVGRGWRSECNSEKAGVLYLRVILCIIRKGCGTASTSFPA